LTTQIRERIANANALQWMKGTVWCTKTAKRAQVMAILPGRSPLGVESEYAAAVLSSKSRPTKTKNLVEMLAGRAAFAPKAANAVRTMRKVVQPW
jgi:ABC-type nitrate/sulfonate/bicarbonate transport system substrate-binding protein